MSQLLTLFLLLPHGHCYNSTYQRNDFREHQHVGWRNSPNERGTITLLWACLSTILVSTWTLLHLNIPGLHDSLWRKTRRKIVWMGITILFPELILSKSVCELQMAIEDLHLMKTIEENIIATSGWTVEFGPGSELLYRMFHVFRSETTAVEQLKTPSLRDLRNHRTVPTRPAWTLTHSYFANMGGLCKIDYVRGDLASLRTTAMLARCCARTDHSPLKSLSLTQSDIEDKSKSDWLAKSIAIAQLTWLIASVIARKTRSLPISQLEICTFAFAVLATMTWLANWYKPKDVDRPINIPGDAWPLECNADEILRGPHYRRLSEPLEAQDGTGIDNRIANDLFRFDRDHPIVAVVLAVSTTLFGGIRFLAWNAEFPSTSETILWKTGIIFSTAIPVITLIMIEEAGRLMNRKIDKKAGFIFRDKAPPLVSEAQSSRMEEYFHTNRDIISDLVVGDQSSNNNDKECSREFGNTQGQNPDESTARMIRAKIKKSLEVFFFFSRRMRLSKHPHRYSGSFMMEADRLLAELPTREGKPDLICPEESKLPPGYPPTFLAELRFHIDLIQNDLDRLRLISREMIDLEYKRDTIIRWIMVTSGVLYLIARFIILGLAFAALRRQDERLYLDTWTRNLPSIS